MDQQTTRYRTVALVVLGVIIVAVAMYFVVAAINGGDDTDQLDPQNGQVVVLPLG